MMLLVPTLLLAFADPVETTVIFRAGEGGYHTYRIPALIRAADGTLLAFAEGRKQGRGDAGDIDVVLKRSSDGGKTWSALQVVWDDGPNTCGNPCPVVDRANGTVWLLLTHNRGDDTEARIIAGSSKGTRTVWISASRDHGQTWDRPRDLTASTKEPRWSWYATGPGVGIQTRSGRLVIPCDHLVEGSREAGSHIIYSDDHGKTWAIGGTTGPKCNECQIVELSDGALLLNMRGHGAAEKRRLVATSRDEGKTFSKPTFDAALIEPVCQASLIALPGSKDGPHRLLFANPASDRKREKLTIRLSNDDGKTWPIARILHAGPAAYSCLTAIDADTIGCLYEAGEKSPYETITFARFPLRWLTAE